MSGEPLDLIERLEAATGPDRQLDGAIAEAIGDERPVPFRAHRNSDEWMSKVGEQWAASGGMSTNDKFIWRYTASIDAALTLVPDDCDWLINRRGNYACVWHSKESGRHGQFESRGARTVASSLCIAALRARAAT